MSEDHAERKLATVLFADLVSSTELGSSQDPERTRLMLDRFYDAMSEEIARAGGTVEKFAGDAVMAVFGVPAAQEDHVERALHAALAMRRRLEELFGGELALRIGVNTGEVVVGRAREQSSFVTGDAVNVAARLEQAAEAGEILVGERAASLVHGAFEFEAPAQVEAKGKPGGVACRKLVRALSLMRPRGVPGMRPVFVGRDRELRVVQDAYERVASTGTPAAVTIMGEAGVGKTRLVRELWEWLGRERSEAVRRAGRCPPYGHARTYAPVGEILREQLGILDGDASERALARLRDREILGLALGLDVAGELHPIEARNQLHDAWIELVAEIAAKQPLVLLVEDVHWAEEPLLELLERMLVDVQAPVLLLATGRPEFLDRSPTWGRGRTPSEWVWLEPLAADEVDRWLGQLLAAEAPAGVRDLLERAEGNPLFLEEVLGTLIQRGVLGGDGWDDALLPTETAIPDTVQAVLASRIDLLPPREKAALQAASVIGRAFWPSAVRELLGGDEPDLRLLEQRDFVRRRAGSSLEGAQEFVFKHALTREVAYGSLTTRERARTHAKLASWLERRGRDEDAPALARHYAAAVRPEDVDLAWSDEPDRHEELRTRAVRWLRRAAELAVSRYEIEAALALLDQALELEPDDPRRIELLTEHAMVHIIRYDTEAFRASMEEALKLGPDPPVAGEIYARLAHYSLGRPYMWKQPPARELGERWLAKALELSPPRSLARGYARLAQAFSQPVTQDEAAAEAHQIGEAFGEVYLIVLSSEARTHAATRAGRYHEACEWVDQALADAKAVGDPGYRGHQYWNGVFVCARAGRVMEACRLADLSDETLSPLGPHEEVHAAAAHAALRSLLGEWAALARLEGRVETASVANDDFPCQFNWRNLLVCALGRAQLGDERDARRLEELGRSSAVVLGPPEREPALLRLALLRADEEEIERILGLLPATGDPFTVDSAAARLDALAALGDRTRAEEEAAPFLGEPSYYRPFALRALGRVREEPALLERAASEFDAMGLGWRAEETRTVAKASR
jgi:class 3 adenylate cyclase/tetratricopeptide (TPR) repeat protein